ncbi:hypothetical protein CRE_08272 [Caenorhabditis remanei]|uniref:Uncharacterized protein n=1 Tax=Caenorhabditis remanei TaxID=31234 RepID=E3M3E3_CAERE|nr:hypothetical protein CRE_08272 [Caenorhabditis remanei]
MSYYYTNTSFEVDQDLATLEEELKMKIQAERVLRDTLNLELSEVARNKPKVDIQDKEKIALVGKLFELECRNSKTRELQKDYEFEDADELKDNLFILEGQEKKEESDNFKKVIRNHKLKDDQEFELLELEREEKEIKEEIEKLERENKAEKTVAIRTTNPDQVEELMDLFQEMKCSELAILNQERVKKYFEDYIAYVETRIDDAREVHRELFPSKDRPQTQEQIETEKALTVALGELAWEKKHRRQYELEHMKKI